MVHLFKPTSYRTGAALAVGTTALWKGLSFINALLIAAYFGADSATDLYFYLLITVGIGWYFLQRLNIAVIIPQAMMLDEQQKFGGRNLLNGYLYLYTAAAIGLILCGWLFPVGLVRWFSRFDMAYLSAQHTLIFAAFVMFALQILSTYLLAILEMYKRFATALFNPLNALLPLIFLLIFGRSYGIISMLWGFILSYGLQTLVLLIMLKKELHWQFTHGEIFHSRQFMQNLLSNQCLEVGNIMVGLLPLYLLSGLNAGTVSALNYAKQLSDSSNEVFVARITNISKIQLTEYSAKQDWSSLSVAYNTAHHLLWFFVTPLVIFTIGYAPQIVTLFFKRGAFSAQSVYETAAFLCPLMILVWLVVPVLMQSNIAIAVRKLKEFLPYALSGIILFVVTVPFAITYFGAVAYVYTQVITVVVGLGINALFFRKYTPQISLKTSLLDGLRLLSCNIIALVPALVYKWYGAGENVWLSVGIGGLIFVAVLAALTWYSGDLKRFLRAVKQTA
ncbi:lipid II flippase MurJ [Candidatus Avelusimicrobium luingense]|uniref:lipid II flippase MurJ n=1 Tax=Candidatus Avelusimicrobium luingense TaxID=3416211 RepID=UPI003D0C839E